MLKKQKNLKIKKQINKKYIPNIGLYKPYYSGYMTTLNGYVYLCIKSMTGQLRDRSYKYTGC